LEEAPPAEREALVAHAARVRDEVWERLGMLQRGLSRTERAFFRASMIELTEQQHIDAMWKIESFQVMLWALGLLEGLPHFDVEADDTILQGFPPEPFASFLSAATVRSYWDLLDQRDSAEVWHLRSVMREDLEVARSAAKESEEAGAAIAELEDGIRTLAAAVLEDGTVSTLMDGDFVAFGKPYRDLTFEEWSTVRSISAERHLALNWLCGYAPRNKWDATPIDR
jgi:hypothetical protein